MGSFHACIPAGVQDFPHPSLKQIQGSKINLTFSLLIYYLCSLIWSYFATNPLQFLFLELHHSHGLIFFVFCNSLLHSSVDSVVSHTSHLITILPSLQFSCLRLSFALYLKLILLSSSFLRTIAMFSKSLYFSSLMFSKNLTLGSLVFSFSNWPSFIRFY